MTTNTVFLTKKDCCWTADSSGYKFCSIIKPGSEKELKFFSGVTRILSRGEQTLKQKLVAELGEKEGKAKAKQIYARGTKAHAKIEENVKSLPENVLAKLGAIVGQEVLLYAENFKNNNILSFADAITQTEDGRYHIIEWKTKNNVYVFQRYAPEDAITKAYSQGVAYAILAKQQYGVSIESVKVVFVFLDGAEPITYTLSRDAFMPYAQLFLQKLALKNK